MEIYGNSPHLTFFLYIPAFCIVLTQVETKRVQLEKICWWNELMQEVCLLSKISLVCAATLCFLVRFSCLLSLLQKKTNFGRRWASPPSTPTSRLTFQPSTLAGDDKSSGPLRVGVGHKFCKTKHLHKAKWEDRLRVFWHDYTFCVFKLVLKQKWI